jgi:hypothetical protein
MRPTQQRSKVEVCSATVCAATALMAATLLLLAWKAHRFEEKTSHLRATRAAAQATGGAATKKSEPTVRARAVESYGKLPLSFEINRGQTDSRVRFLSRGSGYSLFLTGNEAVLSLRKPVRMANGKNQMAKGVAQGSPFNPAAFPLFLRAPAAESDTNSALPT